ncbi:hypothetical protein CFP56_004091 [Quercus suber]|uniref:Uncharacterized protein n=1 Tax=Quercus suber TaxID=58331 RepID=A0AAW0I4U6_QUESU
MKVVVQMLEREGDKLTMPPNSFATTSPTRINASMPISPTRINASMPIRRLNQELEVIPKLE